MTVPDVNAPPVGEHGAPCAVCAAPLASDQRYCLSCGTRRAEARLPFREILTTNAAVAAVTPAAPAATRGAGDDDSNRSALMALASIGCLLLALGVGVLIGGAGDSGTPVAAPAPQVISVAGATGATDAAAAAAGAAGAATGTAAAKKKASKAAGSSSTPTTQKNSLKKLEKLSPTQYQKQSTKLPKVVGTGGAPPPKDNKAPAGGGDFQSIG
jgi:hypothetical protein